MRICRRCLANGAEAQPANQPELQQPASRSAAIRLLATLGLRGHRLKVRKFRSTAIRSGKHRKNTNLGQAALEALHEKITAAKRGSPNQWQSKHETKYSKPLSNFNFKKQIHETQFNANMRICRRCLANGAEAQPANQPELQQPASRSAAIRLLATLGLAEVWATSKANSHKKGR